MKSFRCIKNQALQGNTRIEAIPFRILFTSADPSNLQHHDKETAILLEALKACTTSLDLGCGKHIHSQLILQSLTRSLSQLHLLENRYVANSLINMYSKCSSMADSQAVFDSMNSPDVVSWNSLISGYTVNGEDRVALEFFSRLLTRSSCKPNARSYMSALMACASLGAKELKQFDGEKARMKCLERGMEIHSLITRSGCALDIFLASTLVDMYAKCGSIVQAKEVFDSMPERNVVAWTALISGYAENGDGDEALELFERMQKQGCAPNSRTFIAVLTACSSLARKTAEESLQTGRIIHSQAAKRGFDSETFLGNTLVDMYGKLGSLADAERVFNKMLHRDVVTWNSMMVGYLENGESDLALEIFDRMKSGGCEPNARSFVCALRACSNLVQVHGKKKCSARGVELHSEASARGFEGDLFVGNTLINMYVKCGCVGEARGVFNKMPRRNTVSWTGIISGYVENGEPELGLELFHSMQREGCPADARAFVAGLMACSSLAENEEGTRVGDRVVKLRPLEKAMEIHSQGVRSRSPVFDAFVTSTLIDMYSKCGSLFDSRAVFDRMKTHDVVAWTALILGYGENGEAGVALELFEMMQKSGCSPNPLTYIAALTACIRLAAKEEPSMIEGKKLVKLKCLEIGRALHLQARARGLESDVLLANTLVDMYSKCGSMKEAKDVFERISHRTVVSWTALMLGYVENGENKVALQTFEDMCSSGEDSCCPDARTFVAALMACANAAGEEDRKESKTELLRIGRGIHRRAAEAGIHEDSDPYLANSLVIMYARCGSVEEARVIFDKMPKRNIVSWTAMISGYTEAEQGELALELFKRMKSREKLEPDARTFIAAIVACGSIAALEKGRELHEEIRGRGLEKDVFVANSLVDFYGRCGVMEEALKVFELMSERNLVTWSSLISGYARQGNTQLVFETLEQMLREGRLQPCGITFQSVLAACSHGGLVEKGKEYFEMMQKRFRIKPEIEHFHCMIDMLGRANMIDEALAMVEKMPFDPSVVTWTTVLAACEKWGNLRAGKRAFDELVRLDNKAPVSYVLMSNIYGSVGMLEEKSRVLKMQNSRIRARD